MEDETFIMKKTEDELWDCLCEAVEAGHGFSLEHGRNNIRTMFMEWMLNREYMVDSMFEDEDED
jgi:hypothetical protein